MNKLLRRNPEFVGAAVAALAFMVFSTPGFVNTVRPFPAGRPHLMIVPEEAATEMAILGRSRPTLNLTDDAEPAPCPDRRSLPAPKSRTTRAQILRILDRL